MIKQKNIKNLCFVHVPILATALVVLFGAVWFAGWGKTNTVAAATNETINFQARLQTSAGNLVADGLYNVEFKIYDAAGSSGSSQGSCAGDSNCLWAETRTGGNTVRVVNGYLTVNLGGVNAFGSINWDQELWLTMNIGGTGSPSWDGEMNPRLKLTAVPFAFRAENLALQTGANTSTLGWDTQTASNNILLPDEAGTLCLQTSSNCGFATGSGQAFLQGGNSFDEPAVLGTNDTNSLVFETGDNPQVTIADGGSVTIQNSTDSTSALSVQQSPGAGGNIVFNVDTTNERVGIGTNTPTAALHLVQGGQGSQYGLRITESGSDYIQLYVDTGNENYLEFGETWSVGPRSGNNHAGTVQAGRDLNLNTFSGSHFINFQAQGTTVANISGNDGATTFRNSANSPTAFQIQNTDDVNLFNVDTSNGEIELGNYNGGVDSVGGALVFANSTNSSTVTINAPNQTTGNTTISLPDTGAGTTDTICLLDLGNCFGSGTGGTLQAAYEAGNTILATDAEGDIDLTVSEATNFSVDITGTGSFLVQDGGNDILRLADGGTATFDTGDSATAFSILNGGDTLFNVDSLNDRVSIGQEDSEGTILALDIKDTPGDPTGVDGAMYFNSITGEFRCYQTNQWVDCLGATTLQEAYNNSSASNVSFSRVQYATDDGDPASATFGATPTEDNLLVATAFERAGTSHTSFSISGTGWTKRVAHDAELGDINARRTLIVWTKVAGSSEPSNIQVSGGDATKLVIQEFEAGSDPVWTFEDGVSNDTGTGSAFPLSTGTTSNITNNDLLLIGVGGWRNQGDPINSVEWNSSTLLNTIHSDGGASGRTINSAYIQHYTGGTKSSSVSWSSTGAEASAALVVFSASASSTPTSEIKLNSGHGALDIQDANTTIGSHLLTVRSSNASGQGNVLFSVDNTGGATVAGDATIQGGTVTLGDTTQQGGIVLHDGGGQTTTLLAGDSSSDLSYTLPTALGSNGDCVKQQDGTGQLVFAACGAASGTLQGGYDASVGGATPEIKLDSTRGAVDIQDADTPTGGDLLAVRTSNGSGLGDTVLGVTASGVRLGQSSALDGSLTFANASNSDTITIQSSAPASGSYTLTLPTALGSTDDCLADTDGSGTLGFINCTADDVFVQGGNAFGETAVLGTTDTNGLSFITDNNTVLSLSGINGAATFQNDSSSALRVSSASSGNSVFTVDTINGEVLLGAPSNVDGVLVFSSSSSTNTTTLEAAAPSANQSITLPNESGTVCLSSGNCSGVGGNGDILQGGNTLGTDIILGSNDNNDLLLETDNETRVTIDTDGNVGVGGASSGDRLSVSSSVSGSLTDEVNDDFDPSIDGAEWSAISNGSASTACGAGSAVSGNALRFTGSGTRSAATIDMDSSSGGTISFYLFTSSAGGGSCEGTEAGEDVVLEYSNNGGSDWTTIAVYDESDFHTIDQVTLSIPAGAQTSSTRFRWSQPTHNGSDFDNWTLDDVVVAVASDEPATIYGYNNSSYGFVDLLRLSSDVGGTNDIKFRVLANGDIYADGTYYGAGGVTTGSADLAEVYRNSDSAKPGDVVVFKDSRTVERSSEAYQTGLAGVVSTKPGFTLNVDESGIPVALSGRVPVKVSVDNGVIQKGDYLTSGPNGKAQKATAAGPTIGTALEDATEDDTIEVFVHLGHYDPVDDALFQNNVLLALQSADVEIGNLNVSGEITAQSLHVSGSGYIGDLTVETAKVNATLTVGGRIISQGEAVTPEALPSLGYTQQELSALADPPVTAQGTDTAGTVEFTTGNNPADGELILVQFSAQYEADPRVVLEPNNAESANLKTYVTKTRDGFTVQVTDPPQANQPYSFDYIIIGSEITASSN